MSKIKNNGVKIAASLMCADPLNLSRDINILESSGVDVLHLDIMDGHFVPNLTFGLEALKKIVQVSKLPKEIHLLVNQPERFVQSLALTPRDTCIFHIEATDKPQKLITNIQKHGARVGIAYNPLTQITTDHLTGIDQILIMTAQPGFKGQKFIEETKTKVVRARDLYRTKVVDIEVDGGMSIDRIRQMYLLGANIFVAGTSSIFRDSAILENTTYLFNQLSLMGIKRNKL